MKPRHLAVLAVVATLLVALTGCRHQAGTAALVDGHRIEQSAVDEAIDTSHVTTSNPQVLRGAKALVLTLLIQERLLVKTLAAHGGTPSTSELAAQHDAALPQSLQTAGLTGAEADAALRDQLQAVAISPDFLPHFLAVVEMNRIFGLRKIDITTLTGAPVSVSPRFGKWDASQLIVRFNGVQPDFLVPSASASTTSVP